MQAGDCAGVADETACEKAEDGPGQTCTVRASVRDDCYHRNGDLHNL
jgi:hypothetical protein